MSELKVFDPFPCACGMSVSATLTASSRVGLVNLRIYHLGAEIDTVLFRDTPDRWDISGIADYIRVRVESELRDLGKGCADAWKV